MLNRTRIAVAVALLLMAPAGACWAANRDQEDPTAQTTETVRMVETTGKPPPEQLEKTWPVQEERKPEAYAVPPELSAVAPPTPVPSATPEPAGEEVPEIELTRSHWPFVYDTPASLEELIVKSRVIARVRLREVTAAAVRPDRQFLRVVYPEGHYTGSLAYKLEVLEYLKGTGSDTVTAYAYGWRHPRDLYTATSTEGAIRLGEALLGNRDIRWDDREAIVLLRYNETEQHLYLGLRREGHSGGLDLLRGERQGVRAPGVRARHHR